MRFILASSSPRRRELLTSIGIGYDIIKPDIDETQFPDEAPLDYVQRLSQQKAAAVATQLTDAPVTILAADTVVILAADASLTHESEILGKPESAAEAKLMLQRLRNRAHDVCTAFTILITGDAPAQHIEVTRTQVIMRDYSDAEIDAYIATGDPFDKAGSYAIQHEGFHPVARIDGSYSNVVGLPVDEVQIALKQLQICP